MSRKAAVLGIIAVFTAAAIFGESFINSDNLLTGTVSAEEALLTNNETDAGTADTISYSRPEEEAAYGPTGSREWIDFSSLEHRTEDESAPVVYFTDLSTFTTRCTSRPKAMSQLK